MERIPPPCPLFQLTHLLILPPPPTWIDVDIWAMDAMTVNMKILNIHNSPPASGGSVDLIASADSFNSGSAHSRELQISISGASHTDTYTGGTPVVTYLRQGRLYTDGETSWAFSESGQDRLFNYHAITNGGGQSYTRLQSHYYCIAY